MRNAIKLNICLTNSNVFPLQLRTSNTELTCSLSMQLTICSAHLHCDVNRKGISNGSDSAFLAEKAETFCNYTFSSALLSAPDERKCTLLNGLQSNSVSSQLQSKRKVIEEGDCVFFVLFFFYRGYQFYD